MTSHPCRRARGRVGPGSPTSSGTLQLKSGSTTLGTSAALSANTLYRIGIHQQKGTGTDGVLEAFVAVGDAAFGAAFANSTADISEAATQLRSFGIPLSRTRSGLSAAHSRGLTPSPEYAMPACAQHSPLIASISPRARHEACATSLAIATQLTLGVWGARPSRRGSGAGRDGP